MEVKVSVSREVILKAWKLINTREWPFEYMAALAEVHEDFTRAVEEADASYVEKEQA